MKVGLLMPHPIRDAASGDRARTTTLASLLRLHGDDVVVISPNWALPVGDVVTDVEKGIIEVGQARMGMRRLLWRSSLAIRRTWDVNALHHDRYLQRSITEQVRRLDLEVIDVQHSYWSVDSTAPVVATVHNVLANPSFDRAGPLKRYFRTQAERRALEASDSFVVFSEEERARVELAYPDLLEKCRVVPIGHPILSAYSADAIVCQNEQYALFVGSMDYGPNRDAAKALIRSWPAVSQRSGVKNLVIAGRRASRLDSPGLPRGVTIESDVDDIGALYRDALATVMPITHGGGVRLKALESMAYGIPIVASALAVDGLGLEDGASFLMAEGDVELADALCTLGEEQYRRRIVDGAHKRWLEVGSPNVMVNGMALVYRDAGASV